MIFLCQYSSVKRAIKKFGANLIFQESEAGRGVDSYCKNNAYTNFVSLNTAMYLFSFQNLYNLKRKLFS